MAAFAFAATSPDAIKCVVSTSQTAPHDRRSFTTVTPPRTENSRMTPCWPASMISVEEDVEAPRPAVEPPKDDVSIVTPDDTTNISILKMSGAPASKRRRVFDDRVNVVPLGPLPAQRPLGPAAHEVWFGCPKD